MATKRIGQASEVITLADARRHLRLVPFGNPLAHPDDPDILKWIKSAREWVELYIERTIGTQTFELALDEFPTAIELNPYVQSVTSIKYIDVTGTEQTINPSDYTLDNYSSPCWITPSFAKGFPTVQQIPNAVKVRYIAGYDVNNSVPEPINSAMLLIIGNLYENRQENTSKVNASLPMGIYTLLQPYRLGLGI